MTTPIQTSSMERFAGPLGEIFVLHEMLKREIATDGERPVALNRKQIALLLVFIEQSGCL